MKITARNQSRTTVTLTYAEFLVLLALSAATVGMIVYEIVTLLQ
jgi:hypothetical protein